MNWKIKSLIQNSIALLPNPLANSLYFKMQRRFGGLKNLDPLYWIRAAQDIVTVILEQGGRPDGKVFFEVGTGRAPILPLAYWLMGAEKVFTVDLNPYLKAEILAESLNLLCQKKTEVEDILKDNLKKERLYQLIEMMDHPFDIQKFFNLTRITYWAPADARNIDISDKSIDFHTSFTVLEHIPEKDIIAILKEGSRLLKDDGLFVHLVDYSDHFAHSDNEISPINFLRYSDSVWNFYAGNRFMYMNRLRHDDYVGIFQKISTPLKITHEADQVVLNLLKSGKLPINKKFSSKPIDTLAITHSMIVAKK